MKKTLLLLSLFISSLFSVAGADNSAIEKAFSKLNIPIQEIQKTPLDNLNMVLTQGGVFYASSDGKYIFQGSIYAMDGKYPTNLAVNQLIPRLNDFAKEAIVFKAANEKYAVTVFTDPTCAYCIKLQNDISEYNKQGITVRYLAFPRQGIDSPEAQMLQSVWCAKDPKAAFSKATKGEKVANATCNINVENHYSLAAQLGISGTPAIIYRDLIMPGLIEPKQLRTILDDYSAAHAK